MDLKIKSTQKLAGKDKLVKVLLENDMFFTVTEEYYYKSGLYDKGSVSAKEYETLKESVSLSYAKKAALGFVSLKLRTSAEVIKKLENMGFDLEIVTEVVTELTSIGYINDRIYVQKYLYDRSKLKPKSKRMLKFELKEKGIDENIIDDVLSDWEIDDLVTAKTIAKKKFGKYDLNDQKVKAKVHSFLKHRGYDYKIIESVVSELIQNKH